MSLRRSEKAKKFLSLMTVFFLTASLQPPAGFGREALSSEVIKAPEDLGIPAYLGKVTDFYIPQARESGKPEKLIIHIQDLHANPDAQKKIRSILKRLAPRLDLVALEGARGPLHPEYFNLFRGHLKANRAVLRDLVRKGEVTGAEWFAWDQFSAGTGIDFQGIEDPGLYREDLQKYRDLLLRRDEVEGVLQNLRAKLETVQSHIFKPEVRDFLKERSRRKDGRFGGPGTQGSPQLAAYLTYLKGRAKAVLEIDLSNPAEQLRFPNLVRLEEIERLTREGSHGALESETRALFETLEYLSLSGDEKEKLKRAEARIASDAPLGRLEAEFLWKVAGQAGASREAFPNFWNALARRVLGPEIRSLDLFREIARLENLLLRKMASSPGEQELVRIMEDTQNLEALLSLELTREDDARLAGEEARISPSRIRKKLSKLMREPGREDPPPGEASGLEDEAEALYKQALRFYAGARSRDEALLQNTLRLLDRAVQSKGSAIGVLVAGGFHTPGLSALMRRRGIAYAVIQPEIRALHEGLAFKVFSDAHAALSGMEDLPGLTKQQKIMLKEILEVGAPALVKSGEVTASGLSGVIARAINDHPLFEGALRADAGQNERRLILNFRGLRGKVSVTPPGSSAQKGLKLQNPSTQGIVDAILSQAGQAYGSMRTAADTAPGAQAPIDAMEFEIVESAGGILLKAGAVNRSEVRAAFPGPELEPRLDTSLEEIHSAPADKQRLNAIHELRAFSRSVPDGTARAEKYLEAKLAAFDAAADRDRARAAADALKAVRAMNVGFEGLEDAGLTSAHLMARAGHYLKIHDPTNARAAFSRTAPYAERSFALASLEERLSNVPAVDADFLRDTDVLFVDTPLEVGLDLKGYKERLIGRAMDIGNALKTVREEESRAGRTHERKLIVIRALVDVDTSEKIHETIKWHAQSADLDYLNYDVVYQPDFSYFPTDEPVEPYVLFGLRGRENDPERAKTEAMLRRLYSAEVFKGVEVDFADIRSAEQSRHAHLAYLATKLAHFNDLAELSSRYGADLSAVALGAGLDKRIKTLFSNPSLGFGGRLLLLTRWVYEQRLVQLAGRRIGNREYSVDEIRAHLDAQLLKLERGRIDLKKLLSDLPRELHVVFWLELILRMNAQNQEDFVVKMENAVKNIKGYETLRGKKVAILGVGYSVKSGLITESPALNLIRRLVKDKGVREFYIADPKAREEFRKWLTQIRTDDLDFQSVRFHGVEDDDAGNVYQVLAKADLGIIATDSNPEVMKLDLTTLGAALQGKPLIDGINLFGLRADGKMAYKLEDVRAKGINLVSVGRRPLGPAFDTPKGYRLSDSRLIETLEDYPVKEYRRMKVAVIGGGYVGLTTAANLSNLGPGESTEGHPVTVVEHPSQTARIEGLNSAETKMPIYEPGLREMIVEAKREDETKKRTIFFTTDMNEALKDAPVVYLAVGTPQQDSGEIDLSYILQAASQVADFIAQAKAAGRESSEYFKSLVIKSTVTPNTFEEIEKVFIQKGLKIGEDYGLVSNPEFLREGQAVLDVTQPDRTILGFYGKMDLAARARSETDLLNLWYPLMARHPHRVLLTDTATAPMSKYEANSWLATSISFANMFAEDADLMETDVKQTFKPLRKDPRIGREAFLEPGCGYGGSCFPKDVRALNYLSFFKTGHSLYGIQIADYMNDLFKSAIVDRTVEKLTEYPKAALPLEGKSIAVWGMTFKPKTDDMREAPSVTVLYELLKKGAAQIRLHNSVFSIPEAPPREANIAHYLQEVYKTFKHEEGYKGNFQEFQVWFSREYIETGRVAFVGGSREEYDAEGSLTGVRDEGPMDALTPQTDALLILTDWDEYKMDPSNLIRWAESRGKPLALIDGRNVFYGSRRVFENSAVSYAGVGARSEVRSPAGQNILNGFSYFSGSTAELQSLFQPEGSQEIDLQQWLARDPQAAPALEYAVKGAGRLFAPDFMAELPEPVVLEVLNTALGAPDSQNLEALPSPALSAARESMAPGVQGLMSDPSSPPVHVITPSGRRVRTADLLPFLAFARPNDRLTLLLPAQDSKVPGIEKRLEDRLIKRYRFSEFIRNVIQIEPYGGLRSWMDAAKHVASEERERQTGILHRSLEDLEQMYLKGRERLYNDRLKAPAALLGGALVLRAQLPDDYEVRNVRLELEARNINAVDFSAQVGQLIQAVRHIATQA